MSDKNISKSKQKRMELEKLRRKQDSDQFFKASISILIPVAIIAIAVIIVGLSRKKDEFDYGKYLNKDGTIKNIDIDEYVSNDYEKISIKKADIVPTDEVINGAIESLLKENATLDTTSEKLSKEGDTLNILFTSYLDGNVYGTVTKEQGGADILIDYEGGMAKEFYDALKGHKAGDTFETNVTYPTDYSVEDIAGKTLKYDITVNGIYVEPELNDDFVKKYASEYGSSVEELKTYYYDIYYKSNLSNAIKEQIRNYVIVKKVPTDYVNHLIKIIQRDYGDDVDAASMGEMIKQTAVNQAKEHLVYQAIYEKAGLTNTEDEVKTFLLENGLDDKSYDSYVSAYGKKYIAQMALEGRVLQYLENTVNIIE